MYFVDAVGKTKLKIFHSPCTNNFELSIFPSTRKDLVNAVLYKESLAKLT